MKIGLLVAVVLGLVSSGGAQTSNASGAGECKLKLAQAPAIRGIRLGMSVEEVLAQIPGSEADSNLLANLSRDYFGSRKVSVRPGSYSTSKEKFAGINAIDLHFLDGRLLSFHVQYSGPEWSSREQFAARVAEVLNLPNVAAWKEIPNGALALTCDGFEISTQPSLIGMRDTRVDVTGVIHEREEVPKEKARRAFKP
jgi:hypothetical protein